MWWPWLWMLILCCIAGGFILGTKWGQHGERERWREAVRANLKRWREEQLQDEAMSDSWLGDK